MVYEGWWNDGRSARRYDVYVRWLGKQLSISARSDDTVLLELPVDGLSLAEEVYAGQPLRFKHTDWPDARLTVEDHALLEKLARVAPRLGRRYHARHGAMRRLGIWGGAFVGTLALLLGIVHFGAAPLAAMVPLAWEEGLGESTMTDMREHHGVCDNGSGVDHLQRLAQRFGDSVDSRYRFKVGVLDSDMVNAFAMPGGYIVISRGLIEQADGPNEVAAVVAHEVAHGIERHPTEGLIRRSGYSLLAGLVTGDMSGLAVFAGDAAAFMGSMANSRAAEREADELGIRLLNNAGIDSNGMAGFFEKLQAEQDAELPQALAFFSTHPVTAERVAYTRALARPGRDAFDAQTWATIESVCGGTEPAED